MTPSGAASPVKKPCPPGCVNGELAYRLIAAGSDLALYLDTDGVIRDVKAADSGEAALGWNKLIGKPWVEIITRESRAKVDKLLEEALSGSVTRAREINLHVGDVTNVPFRFSAVFLESDKRVVALGRDLRAVSTLQQQMIGAQQAMDREYARLRQAETRYRLLFQVASEGVVVAEAGSLKVVEVNQAASSMLEDSAASLQGKPLSELFEPRHWAWVQGVLNAVDAGARANDVQASLAGKRREVTVSAHTFRQAGSTYVLLRLRPLRPEQAQAGSREARLLAVMEALPDSVVVISEDHRILCANTAFCDLVQQASENLVVGQPLERWLGRPGVDLNILLANLREHQVVRNFATIVRGEYGAVQEAVVSGVSALDGKVPSLGLSIRPVPARLTTAAVEGTLPRSMDQLRDLVGRVPLKDIVRESADLIEKMCIEAALKVSGDNRASAAQLLGLSRQGLYSKLRRHGLGEGDDAETD